MEKFIVIPLYDHTTTEEAQELADDLKSPGMQPVTKRRGWTQPVL